MMNETRETMVNDEMIMVSNWRGRFISSARSGTTAWLPSYMGVRNEDRMHRVSGLHQP